MKASDWTVVAMLANMAVICLAHPRRGGDSGRRHSTGVDDSHIVPNDERKHSRDIGRSSNNKFSAVGRRGYDSRFGRSQDGGGHASGEWLNDGNIALSGVGEYSGGQGSGRHFSSTGGELHGGEHDGSVNGGGFYYDYTPQGVGGSQAGGAGSQDGSVPDAPSVDYVYPGAAERYDEVGRVHSGDGGSGGTHGGSAEGREYVATATMTFNLGAPLQRSGGYSDANGASVDEYGGGGGRSAYDSNGFITDCNNGGDGCGGYINQGDVGGLVRSHNVDGGVRGSEAVGGEYDGGSGGEFGGVNIDGIGDLGYREFVSEHNGGGYDGGVSGHIFEGVHSGGEDIGGYNPVNRNGALVGGEIDEEYLTSSSNDGGVGGHIFEGVHSGSGEDIGGYNPVDRNGALIGGKIDGEYLTSSSNDGDVGGHIFEAAHSGVGEDIRGYNPVDMNGALVGGEIDGEYLTSSSNDGGVGGHILEGAHSGGGEDIRSYNPVDMNGALVGGEIDGEYLTLLSNNGAHSVSAVRQGGVPERGYITQVLSEDGISPQGYGSQEVNGGFGSRSLYSTPAMGGGSRLGRGYNSVSSDEGKIGHQSSSIVQPGILEAEYVAQSLLKKRKEGKIG